jgi:hypothetical protein
MLQPLPFRLENFINRAAVRAGEKIPLTEAEEGQKKEGKHLKRAGEHSHGGRNTAAGKNAASARAEIFGTAGYTDDKKHGKTS